MKFSIHFVENATVERSIWDEDALLGEIVLGKFRESFEVPIGYWQAENYIKQWNEGLERIVKGDSKQTSAIVVTMYDPKIVNFITWWTLYRDGETVYIHNQLLMADDLKEPFNLDNLYDYVGERDIDDGEDSQISEWKTDIKALESFLRMS